MNKRKIILNLAVSLDGFIEGKNGEFDWCFTDQDYGMKEFTSGIDTMFMGRKSYDLFSGDMKKFFPNINQIVFSTTLKDKNVDIISKNIVDEVNKITNQDGKNIWMFGGAKLTKTLMDLKLIDEISILVHPLILGGGTPLFLGSDDRIKLELISSDKYSSGGIKNIYKVLN